MMIICPMYFQCQGYYYHYFKFVYWALYAQVLIYVITVMYVLCGESLRWKQLETEVWHSVMVPWLTSSTLT
jgi:hypothetical protein